MMTWIQIIIEILTNIPTLINVVEDIINLIKGGLSPKALAPAAVVAALHAKDEGMLRTELGKLKS